MIRATGSFWIPEPGEQAGWSPLTSMLFAHTTGIARGILNDYGIAWACRTTDNDWNIRCLAPARVEAVRRLALLGEPAATGTRLDLGGATTDDKYAMMELSREIVELQGLREYQLDPQLYMAGSPYAPTMVGREFLPGTEIYIDVPIVDGQPLKTPQPLRDAWGVCVDQREAMFDVAHSRAGGSLTPANMAAWQAIREETQFAGAGGSNLFGYTIPQQVTDAIDAHFAQCFKTVADLSDEYVGIRPTLPGFDFDAIGSGTGATTGSTLTGAGATTTVVTNIDVQPASVDDIEPTEVVIYSDEYRPVSTPAPATMSGAVKIGLGLGLLLLLWTAMRRRRA